MALSPPGPYTLIGKSQRRTEAPERLTGQTRFTDDLALPGLLHARLVRSPYASALITGIDRAAAEALPGVVRVLTARDLPIPNIQDAVDQRRVLLALDRVVHAGQPVAIVLAESDAAAEDGAEAVQVTYEPRPAVVDPMAALRPDAPVVRERNVRDDEELAMHGATPQGHEEDEAPQSPNVTNHVLLERGDVEQGFREAAVIVEHEFRTNWIHQSYIEPQTCAANVDPLGSVVVYACTQALFHTRTEVAHTLGLPISRVRVYPMPVGGGFGGKFGLIEPMVAACAKAVNRPVRLTFTRLDEFATADPAPMSVIRVKAGATADGTLSVIKGEVFFDAGAKSGSPAGLAALMLGAFYRWQHLRVEGTEVLTNKVPTGAYRAPGAPQAAFASESTVDELARKLGMDPFEIRTKNAVREGDSRPDGLTWPLIGLHECLARAEPIYRAEQAAAGPNEGVGIALGGWFGGVEPSAAVCRLEPDGTLMVSLGSVDLTGTNTTFQAITAEAFGLDSIDQVRVSTVDTDGAPYAGATGGSKITYTVGPSVKKASEDARDQVLKIAAAELEAGVEDLEIVHGEVRVKGVPGKVKTLGQLFALSGSFGASYEPVYGRGQSAITDRSPGLGVHGMRVYVDPDTGRVQPLHYVIVQDVGTAINPATVEEQIHGGGAQGVGWGLYEQMLYDADGASITASLMDYTVPKATQLPAIQAVLVQVPSALGPYGAKGVGEPPVIPGAAACANAVANAIGVRVTEAPLTPERVRQAMLAGQAPRA